MKQKGTAVSQLRRLESPFHTEEMEVGVRRLFEGFALTTKIKRYRFLTLSIAEHFDKTLQSGFNVKILVLCFGSNMGNRAF